MIDVGIARRLLRLDVAVHYALLVRVTERLRHIAQDLHRIGDRQRAVPHELVAQREAIDKWHHVEEQPVRLARIVEREHVRVLQRRRDSHLTQEPFLAERRREILVQHLDRDVPLVLDVAREVDRGHATFAELTLDGVAVREGGLELFYDRPVQCTTMATVIKWVSSLICIVGSAGRGAPVSAPGEEKCPRIARTPPGSPPPR